jgi:tetratricopeptide (TPR) repeat protein
MNRIVQIILLLIISTAICGQQSSNRDIEQATASVRDLKGNCFIRDGERGSARKLKLEDRLKAGQQLQCEPKSYLKIRFSASGEEKEIKTVNPDWYVIPNVPGSSARGSGPKLAGRAKGNQDSVVAESGALETSQVSATSRARSVERSSTFDDVELAWRSRKKFFLIVAASQTGSVTTNLPFTKIDARKVSEVLTSLGYQQLNILTDQQSTRDNFVTELQKVRDLPSDGIVLVYYSGHAVTDWKRRDLWLQLYGQTVIGEYRGISVSELVDVARSGAFKGQLSIILDSCYSGQAGLTSQLSLKDTENTVIFASSSYSQPSFSKLVSPGVEVSAFTYYLTLGLGTEWSEVDEDKDGIISYSDLQKYIGTKLLEDRPINRSLGNMTPQLFGQSQNSWVAYDARHLQNRDTLARKAVRLNRIAEVRAPDDVMNLLSENAPQNEDTYLKALRAVKAERFEEAERLLRVAETEDQVSPVVIAWTRGDIQNQRDDIISARSWYEKALDLSDHTSLKLLQAAAIANSKTGNVIRSKALFKEMLSLPSQGFADDQALAGALFTLTFLNIVDGSTEDAHIYLARLRTVDRVILNQLDGMNMNPFVDIMADFLYERRGDAKRNLDALRQSITATNGLTQQTLSAFVQAMDVVLSDSELDRQESAVSAQTLDAWNRALINRDVQSLVTLLRKLQLSVGTAAGVDSLRRGEVTNLLKRTEDFADSLADKRRELTNGANQPAVLNDKESVIESSIILTNVAKLYFTRQDTPDAERLLKEALRRQDQEKAEITTSFEVLMQLAALYEDTGRFPLAEGVYQATLAKFPPGIGEQNFYVFRVYRDLGNLYSHWQKFDDAERCYKTLVQLTEAEPSGALGNVGREILAQFFADQGRNNEAIPLFEKVIANQEQKQQVNPKLVDESLGKDYFQLATQYYYSGHFDLAEKHFRKAWDFLTTRKQDDLDSAIVTLVWQTFTAESLKKTSDAERFFQELLQLISAELNKPTPDHSIGSTLCQYSGWFSDDEQYDKAEKILQATLPLQQKAYGAENMEVAYVWEWMGDLENKRGRYTKAITLLRNAADIYGKQHPPANADLSYTFYRIGYAQYNLSKLEEARIELQEAVALLDNVPEEQRTNNLSRDYLVEIDRLLGDFEDAKKIVSGLLKEDLAFNPVNTENVLTDYLNLTSIARASGHRDEAQELLTKAKTWANKINPDELKTGWPMLDHEIGMLALETGKDGEAETSLATAVRKAEQNPRMDKPLVIEYLNDYVRILLRRNKDKEASEVKDRAKRLRDALSN